MKPRHCSLLALISVLLTYAIGAAQQGNPSDPEYIGVIYYLDPSAKLLSLDRQIPHPKASLRALGFGGAKAIVELDAERASLRVPSNQELGFVVELARGVDPREFRLYPLAVRNGKRQLVMNSGSVFGEPHMLLPIQINISRYGARAYKITPGSKLAEGEYAFMGEGSTEVFCFGVDRKK
jgi:hypothetical protein